jgi:hypothetical protein
MKEKYEKKVEALKKKFVFARPKNEDDLPFWD